jgi:hypothetical protein
MSTTSGVLLLDSHFKVAFGICDGLGSLGVASDKLMMACTQAPNWIPRNENFLHVLCSPSVLSLSASASLVTSSVSNRRLSVISFLDCKYSSHIFPCTIFFTNMTSEEFHMPRPARLIESQLIPDPTFDSFEVCVPSDLPKTRYRYFI